MIEDAAKWMRMTYGLYYRCSFCGRAGQCLDKNREGEDFICPRALEDARTIMEKANKV